MNFPNRVHRPLLLEGGTWFPIILWCLNYTVHAFTLTPAFIPLRNEALKGERIMLK
jgi:hypothetical protein